MKISKFKERLIKFSVSAIAISALFVYLTYTTTKPAKPLTGNEFDRLLGLRWETKYDKSSDEYLMRPVLTQAIKDILNKEISLVGFYVPDMYSEQYGFFFLSAYPAESCFFCDASVGAESILEIYPAADMGKPSVGSKLSVKGTLRYMYKEGGFPFSLHGAVWTEMGNSPK